MTVEIVGVSQLNSNPGVFVLHNGNISIDSSNSLDGQIASSSLVGTIANSSFGRKDWIDTSDLSRTELELSAVTYGYSKEPTYVRQKSYGPAGASWPTARSYLPIVSGTGSNKFAISSNTRVVAVTLILDTPALAGAINVGDTGSSKRYFGDQSLSKGNVTSAISNVLYSSASEITAASSNASGVKGYVAIDYQVLN